MILVDTSVWINHLRSHDALLKNLLVKGGVLTHPFVIGELSMGVFPKRKEVIAGLKEIPLADIMEDEEMLLFIESNSLAGKGIGYVDAHLLGAVSLSKPAKLLTYDKNLHKVASKMGLSANFTH
ncbi:MAG: PIN domain-containing protein [Candidatus Dadabacteria bacterium]|nr:PIN domain-containing protein [Candidatus Dadabacteria bacterium]